MSLTTTDTSNNWQAEIAQLFPLPLSTMEAFMLADGRPDYPMMCDVVLHFDGRMERDPFDAALALAVERAPIFRSIVRWKGKQPQWVLTDRLPPVDWDELGAPYGTGYDELIDLTVDVPVRVYVRAGDDQSTVLVHMHHAGADGLGSMAFAEDFMAAYANASAGQPVVEMRPLNPARLLLRGTPSVEPVKGWRAFADGLVGMREGLRFFFQRPLRLAPRTPPANSAPAGADGARVRQQVGFIHQTCPEEVAVGLRSVAAQRKVTVNDLLMRDLYLTLAAWNERSKVRHIRILMPQNLRELADGAMPATNRLGFAFLTRHANWCARPLALLTSLEEETTAIVQGQLSRYFLDGLATMQATGLLKHLLRGSYCFSTAILTNLGNPHRRFVTQFPRAGAGLQVGNLVFTGVTAMPPLRPHTAAAFCITGHAQSFNICLKCDSYSFTRAETEALLTLYLAQLAKTASRETDGD